MTEASVVGSYRRHLWGYGKPVPWINRYRAMGPCGLCGKKYAKGGRGKCPGRSK